MDLLYYLDMSMWLLFAIAVVINAAGHVIVAPIGNFMPRLAAWLHWIITVICCSLVIGQMAVIAFEPENFKGTATEIFPYVVLLPVMAFFLVAFVFLGFKTAKWRVFDSVRKRGKVHGLPPSRSMGIGVSCVFALFIWFGATRPSALESMNSESVGSLLDAARTYVGMDEEDEWEDS